MEDYEKEFGALVGADVDGKISWPKFKNWISRTNYFVDDGSKTAGRKLEILVAICDHFQSYDKCSKGYITIDEFTAVKNFWRNYANIDTETLFKLVDNDGNKKITFKEYYHFFFHPNMKIYYPDVFDNTKRSSILSLKNV